MTSTDPPDIRERIAKNDLIAQSGVSAADIDRFVATGLIGGPDREGSYDRGHITRLRFLAALKTSGIPLDQLTAAVAEGRLSLDLVGTAVADPPSLAPMTVAEACAANGVTLEDFRREMLASGAAASPADEPIREDDLELMRICRDARNLGVPTEAILGVQRGIAIGMRQIVETQREFYPRYVEEPMIAKGMSYMEALAAAAETRIALQRMAYRVVFLLQRRFIEQLVYDNLVVRFEETLEAGADSHARKPRPHTVCFVDLSGFTERTERLGDDDAARLATSLVEIAQNCVANHHGSLVKALGDGAMLHFGRADDAVRCALSIIASARVANLPPARAGISTGAMIIKDGDYYGRAVNRAARLVGVAKPEQVLVTAETVAAVPKRAFHFDDLGAMSLKGIQAAVHAYAATAE